MRKKNLGLTGMLLSALVLAGCSNDGTLPGTEGNERVALRVTSGIKTRAVDTLWQEGDAIGIYMLDGNGEPDSYYANMKYVTKDNGESGTFNPAAAENTIYLPESGETCDFIAYYPWTDCKLEGSVYNIDLTDQTSQKDIDFMMAAKVTGICRDKYTVPFVFTHKLTKIVMEVKAGADIDDADLAGMTIKLTNQPTIGTFDVVTSTEVAPDTKTDKKDITLLTAADGKKAEAIIFPSTDYNGMNFRFETKTVGNYKCEVPSNKAQKFEAGKKYKYTITINKTEIEVTSTITDWLPGNGEGDSGNAE